MSSKIRLEPYLSSESNYENLLIGFSVLLTERFNILFKKHFKYTSCDEVIQKSIIYDVKKEIKKIAFPTVSLEYSIYLKAYEKDDNECELKNFLLNITLLEEWTYYFFETYPVLLNTLHNFYNFFLKNSYNFIKRLNKDFIEINNHFSIGNGSSLHDINLFLGDPHKMWQTTAKVTIENSNTLQHIYYKPRILKGDIFFNGIITFLNSLGLEQTLTLTEVIVKKNYSWQKGENYSYSEEKNVSSFYFQQGINTAIAFAFNIQDLIGDNIVVSRSFPCFFDLEMNFSPKIKKGLDYRTKSKAGEEFLEGVIKTGLIPSFGFETVNNKGYSNGGISKISESEYNVYVRGEQLNVLLNQSVENDDLNLPFVNGKAISVDNFCSDFELGFVFGCNFIVENKQKILNYIRSNKRLFEDVEVRFLIRTTHVYSGLLKESTFPLYMSNHLEYFKLFEMLWRAYDGVFINEAIIQNEIYQISNNEIPYYYTYLSSRDLYDSSGKIVVNDFFEQSGYEYFENRISELDNNIIQKQNNVINRALFVHNNYEKEVFPFLADIKVNFLPKDIGDFLYTLGAQYKDNDYFTYHDYIITKDDIWNQGIQSCDIFQGIEGVGIFFAALYSYTKDTKYLHSVETIYKQSKEYFLNNFYSWLDNPISKTGITNFPVSTNLLCIDSK